MSSAKSICNHQVLPTYYTGSGQKVRDPEAYALTGALCMKLNMVIQKM